MIVFDTPRSTAYRHFRMTAHLGSTEPGEAGRQELLDFAGRIGLRARWLQAEGTPKEHFDLFDRRIDRARAAGAKEVTARDFVRQVVRPKRAGVRDAVAGEL